MGCRQFISFMVLVTSFFFSHNASSKDLSVALRKRIEKIDRASEGTIGFYFKRLQDNLQVRHNVERDWYLASTMKVPVAIILLQKHEAGHISLDEEIVLQKSDLVDGSGDLVKTPIGTRFKIRELLERMLTESDSVAADLLIRRIGVTELNTKLAELSPGGFKNITTLLQVRHDAYQRLHPKASSLTNDDFIKLKELVSDEERIDYLSKRMQVPKTALKFDSIPTLFEDYYKSGLNSGSLIAFGRLLEKLFKGELLSPANTQLVLGYMEKMETGGKRIKAGLPPTVRFAQKTGTQVRRICNVGIVRKPAPGSNAVIVAACVEKFSDQAKAVDALKEVGAAISSYL